MSIALRIIKCATESSRSRGCWLLCHDLAADHCRQVQWVCIQSRCRSQEGMSMSMSGWNVKSTERLNLSPLKAKVWANYACDRIIDRCNDILTGFARIGPSWLKPTLKLYARGLGNLCLLWRDLPRQSIYDLIGDAWRIRVVGQDIDAANAERLFFGGEHPDIQIRGRVPLWRLRRQVPKWLAHEMDLVICRTSYGSPFRVGGSMTFVVPNGVEQCLDLETPINVHLAGRRGRGIRTRINRMEQAGFGYRFTQLGEDFDKFYYEMYRPFITSRHGRLTVITSYEQLKAYLNIGGLLFITRNGLDVARNDLLFPGRCILWS